MISFRDFSGFSEGKIPAASSSGNVSSNILPFDSAMVITSVAPEDERGFYRKELKKIIYLDSNALLESCIEPVSRWSEVTASAISSHSHQVGIA